MDAVADTVAEAVRDGEIAPVEPRLAAAAIIGIVVQTATFHIYGRLHGPLTALAPTLARAALAAVDGLAAPSRRPRAERRH